MFSLTFIFAFISLVLPSYVKSQIQCKRYNCLDLPTILPNPFYCLNESTSGLVNTYGAYCQSFSTKVNKSLCAYGETTTTDGSLILGSCYNATITTLSPEYRYPGEDCDTLGLLYICVSGMRQCFHNKCLGFGRGQYCSTTQDCDPGLYCKSGICSIFENFGATCTNQYACGRTAKCFSTLGSNLTANPGTCVQYFTLANGSSIVLDNITDHFLCAAYSANTNSADSVNYLKCGMSGNSLNKGKSCSSNTNCPTSQNSTTNCTCGYNNEGFKYCSPDYGDPEWASVAQFFSNYLNKTAICHVARGFDYHCFDIVSFNAYKCALMKFKYYQNTIKTSSCLQKMSNAQLFPEINLIYSYCGLTSQAMILISCFSIVFIIFIMVLL